MDKHITEVVANAIGGLNSFNEVDDVDALKLRLLLSVAEDLSAMRKIMEAQHPGAVTGARKLSSEDGARALAAMH